MSRHRREEPTSLKAPLVIIAALVVAVLAGYGIIQSINGSGSTGTDTAGADAVAATGTAEPTEAACSAEEQVTVLAAPDIAPVLTELVRTQTGCVQYTVVSRSSEEVTAALTGDAPAGGQVWVPDSLAAVDAVRQTGAQVQVGPVIATTPVVLAAEREVFAARTDGLAEDPAWADLVTSELPLVVGDPTRVLRNAPRHGLVALRT